MGQGGEFKLKKAHGSEAGTMVVEHVEAYAQPDGRIAKAFISNWAKLRSSLAPRVAFARCVCAREGESTDERGLEGLQGRARETARQQARGHVQRWEEEQDEAQMWDRAESPQESRSRRCGRG